MNEFVAGEPGTLVIGSCFGVEHLVEGIECVEGTDDAKGGAIACCSKRTGDRSQKKGDNETY